MGLNALYKKYFQKSKIFLYPLLDIKKGCLFTPTETYVAWEDNHNPEDMKLICIYHNTDNPDYASFEKLILFKSNRITDFIKINETTSVYIFDFSDMEHEWHCFLNGKYSKMNETIKRKILNFFKDNSANYEYVNSYLFPEKFFEQYANILAVDIELLKSVGELCSKPDMSKEKLVLKVADLGKLNITY